ncbi:MAG TPA: cytochrome P450 [Myxococcota bacterium]|nr:cytochrome P450 [Myxococcota bacterium]
MADVEYNPYAYAIHEDPYPTYAALRARAPVYRNDALDFWALSRHADVLAAFKDTETFSNDHGVSLDPESWGLQAAAGTSFLAFDPPRHTRLRALVSKGFTPRRVAALEQRIRDMSAAYLDPLIGAGRFDFIAELAGKVPMDVISEMLGVARADRPELRRRADLLVHREEGHIGLPREGALAFAWIRSYFRALLADRRARRGDDLLSALLEAEIDGERLDENDILSFANLMIVAGNETTTKMLANAIYWLWRHPEQRALVREAPEARIPAWIEETLRFDNSTQMLARRVARDVELHGHTLRAGDRALLLVGSANRDERVFERAGEYDLLRDTSQSVSFGRGVHFCLGAALARLEGRVVLEEWWRRLPDYEIDPAGAVRVHSINVRGFAALPVKV